MLSLFGTIQLIQAQEDKYQWLEDVDGQRSLEFVNVQNNATVEKLSKEKDFQSIYNKSLEISNSTEKIAYPSIRGNYVYNFWKDKEHVRGIWRRCLLTDYVNGKTKWDILLDMDELSKKDNIKWVFKAANGLYPTYTKFLIELSKGGGDAVVIKEFDVEKKQFIENGFSIEEAKGSANYVDENTLIVSTNFGEETMTSSGYPRQVKLWKRGTLLKNAQLIYEGQQTDVLARGSILRGEAKDYIYIQRVINFFKSQNFIWTGDKTINLDLPEDCAIEDIIQNQLIIQLKSDWIVNAKKYPSGSVLSLDVAALLQGKKNIQVVLVPDKFSSVAEISTTKNHLLINLLSNVTSKLFIYSFSNKKWTNQPVKAPKLGTISITTTAEFSDQYFFNFSNFLTPTTLFFADAGKNASKPVKSLPAFFDASKYEVNQFKAKSKDGTLVPYFVVYAKKMPFNSNNATLIYAYGGFEISSKPTYNPLMGSAWLDKGGVYVLANIRGGGEFGPTWHLEGIKEKRQNVFDDLYAVSEDLIKRKITSPKHLGVMGGSNGGLLVGVAFTQRPELYNAVVCQVPLLDMQRYNKLLAGASWMGEYGNPDIPEEWEYIKKYSPYQNVKEGLNYPEVFFYTSTRDDRVHPGHARKMVAKLNDMGYKTYYYENTEGGHAGSSTNEQSAKSNALTFSYLLMKLK